MKPFRSNAALALAFFTALSSSAQAFDLTSKQADLFIQVTKSGELRKFELCSKKKGPESCRVLGHREWYSVKELKRQRLQEEAEGAVSIVGTAAVAVVAYFTLLLPVGVAAAGVGLAGAVSGPVVILGTSTVLPTALYTISDLGPIEQMKQQYLLRADVINDEVIDIKGAKDGEMQEIADRLNVVLGKI